MVHSSVPGYDNGGIAMTTSLTCLKPYLSVSFSLFESMFSRCKNPAKLYPIKYPPKKLGFFLQHHPFSCGNPDPLGAPVGADG